jgi:hypothetical protein
MESNLMFATRAANVNAAGLVIDPMNGYYFLDTEDATPEIAPGLAVVLQKQSKTPPLWEHIADYPQWPGFDAVYKILSVSDEARTVVFWYHAKCGF